MSIYLYVYVGYILTYDSLIKRESGDKSQWCQLLIYKVLSSVLRAILKTKKSYLCEVTFKRIGAICSKSVVVHTWVIAHLCNKPISNVL